MKIFSLLFTTVIISLSAMAQDSVEFYMALKKFKIPAEMHIFRNGGHGFGMNKKNFPVDQWPVLFSQWMKAQGLTN